MFPLSQNPQSDLQAQDRCHRIGQTKPVLVYRLITANTIDQKILERASAKRKLEQMVIHKSELQGCFILSVHDRLTDKSIPDFCSEESFPSVDRFFHLAPFLLR